MAKLFTPPIEFVPYKFFKYLKLPYKFLKNYNIFDGNNNLKTGSRVKKTNPLKVCKQKYRLIQGQKVSSIFGLIIDKYFLHQN